jgi:hypothetical protein
MDKNVEVLLKLSGEVAVGRGCVVEEVPFIDGEALFDGSSRKGFPVYEGTCSNW